MGITIVIIIIINIWINHTNLDTWCRLYYSAHWFYARRRAIHLYWAREMPNTSQPSRMLSAKNASMLMRRRPLPFHQRSICTVHNLVNEYINKHSTVVPSHTFARKSNNNRVNPSGGPEIGLLLALVGRHQRRLVNVRLAVHHVPQQAVLALLLQLYERIGAVKMMMVVVGDVVVVVVVVVVALVMVLVVVVLVVVAGRAVRHRVPCLCLDSQGTPGGSHWWGRYLTGGRRMRVER
jgi:hypothetical protein